MSYEHLLNHIEKNHPDILQHFLNEWQALPQFFRQLWNIYGESRPIRQYAKVPVWYSWESAITKSYLQTTNLRAYFSEYPALSEIHQQHTGATQSQRMNYILRRIKELAICGIDEINLPFTEMSTMSKSWSSPNPKKDAFLRSDVRKVLASITTYSAFENMVLEFCKRVQEQDFKNPSDFEPQWGKLLTMLDE